MKFLCAFIVLCGCVNSVFAAPFLYSFSGNVTSISENDVFMSSSVIDGVMFSVNDPLEYRFVIDLDRPGSCFDPNAIPSDQCTGGNINDVPGFDFFYTDLAYASKEVPLTYLDITYNYGVNQSAGLPKGQVFGSSSVWLESPQLVQDWVVGTMAAGFDDWDNGLFGADAVYGRIQSSMILQSIVPVSAPGVLVLLLLGLTGLGLSRLRA